MRRALHLTVVAVLVVALAGCNGLAGVNPGPGPDTTVENGESPTATPASPPPGVTTEKVTDAEVLADAHEQSLNNLSYTFTRTETLRYANGTEYSSASGTMRVGDEHDHYRSAARVNGSTTSWDADANRTVEVWSNGTTTFTAARYDGRSVYNRGEYSTEQTTFGAIYRVLGSFELTTTGRTVRNGETQYYLLATNVTSPSVMRPQDSAFSPAGNVSLTAIVEADGLVRQFQLAYDVRREGTTLRVTKTMRFSDVGSTSVERPEWLPAALDETGETTDNETDDMTDIGTDETTDETAENQRVLRRA